MTPNAAPWSSNVTQPVGGGAQARIAEHLSAGASPSAGLAESEKRPEKPAYFRTKYVFDPSCLVENVLVWTKYRTAEFAEHPMSRSRPEAGLRRELRST